MSAHSLEKNLKRPGNIRFYRQLTPEVVGTSRGHSPLIDILGVIFLVFLMNWAALWYVDRFPQNRAYWLIKEKWRLLHTLKASVEWVVLGDSSGNQGVIPEQLTARLGGRSINLCTIGPMGLLNDAWMLETCIKKYGPPKNVIIVHAYDVWHRKKPKPILISRIPLPWGFWDMMHPGPELDVHDKMDMFLSRYFPLYVEHSALRKVMRNPRNLFKNDFVLTASGYMPCEKSNPQKVRADTKSHLKFVAENKAAISRMNQEALSRIITLAESHGIRVFFVNSPLYEGLFMEKGIQKYLADLQTILKKYTDDKRYVYYLGDVATFPSGQMESVDHVTDSAAKMYTMAIADKVTKIGDRTFEKHF